MLMWSVTGQYAFIEIRSKYNVPLLEDKDYTTISFFCLPLVFYLMVE